MSKIRVHNNRSNFMPTRSLLPAASSLAIGIATIVITAALSSTVVATHHDADKDDAKSADATSQTEAQQADSHSSTNGSSDDADETAKLSTTFHEVEIAGEKIAVTATAGKMQLKSDTGKTKAEIFFIAYTQGDQAASDRPVTFCFNGGPGSSSVWLHLGMLGPKRVKLDSDARPSPPPYE
ncbi:MAG: hypothetical protein AAF961_19485, partial [Planctomycetota bacterium]